MEAGGSDAARFHWVEEYGIMADMGDKVLEIDNVVKSFGGVTAVDGLTLSLTCGEVTGFLGTNGAGKTTTLKSMLGLVHPDGGAVEMFGMDFRKKE